MAPPSFRPSHPNRTLPRILCLHGGGTSASIFAIQTIRLQRLLIEHFVFIFAEGPFASPPGPGVVPFFEGMGPYWRWIEQRDRRADDGNGNAGDAGDGIVGVGGVGKEIEGVRLAALERAIKESEAEGETGQVVGVLGFSQGASMAAGVLLAEQERREERGGGENALLPNTHLRFGILCNSGHPALSVFPSGGQQRWDVPLSSGTASYPHQLPVESMRGVVHIPTVHVHGLQDGYLKNAELMVEYFKPETRTILKFEVEHRLPVTKEDNEALVQVILGLWKGSDRAERNGVGRKEAEASPAPAAMEGNDGEAEVFAQ